MIILCIFDYLVVIAEADNHAHEAEWGDVVSQGQALHQLVHPRMGRMGRSRDVDGREAVYAVVFIVIIWNDNKSALQPERL